MWADRKGGIGSRLLEMGKDTSQGAKGKMQPYPNTSDNNVDVAAGGILTETMWATVRSEIDPTCGSTDSLYAAV